MPSRNVHNIFAKMALEMIGRKVGSKELSFINKVNKWVDIPHIFLGNKHRILFHSMDGLILAYVLAKKYGMGLKEAMAVFLTHKLLDKLWSEGANDSEYEYKGIKKKAKVRSRKSRNPPTIIRLLKALK